MNLRIILSLLLGCILCSCSPSKQSSRTSTETPVTISANREITSVSEKIDSSVIGHLEKRGAIITIYAGYDGPLYTITKKDGTVVAHKINEKQLQAKHPELYRDLKTGIADNDASLIKDADPPITIFKDK